MTAQNLIQAITDVATGNFNRDLEFLAMFEVGAVSSEDDQMKEVQLRFKDCIVSTRHPTKIQITLC